MVERFLLSLKIFAVAISFKFLNQHVDGACDRCSNHTNFACLSRTQYVRCNATAIDLRFIHVCPSPTVCNETLPINAPLSLIPCYRNTTGFNVTAGCRRPFQTFVTNTSTFSASTWCKLHNEITKLLKYFQFHFQAPPEDKEPTHIQRYWIALIISAAS